MYLQSWVESSKDLPAELVRCFKLLQELDHRSHALQQSVDRSAAEQLDTVRLVLYCWISFPEHLSQTFRLTVLACAFSAYSTSYLTRLEGKRLETL